MKFKYCPKCGSELIEKEIGDEGLIPFCPSCEIPFFDWVPTCTITVVTNEKNEVLLLKQGYVSNKWVLVAGFMKKGESAEESSIREIEEESGQVVESIKYKKSYYYEKRNLLMLGFHAKVKTKELLSSIEVDDLSWNTYEKAISLVRDGSIGHKLLLDCLKDK